MDERISLKNGTIINNKYTILSQIGRGGSCIVYEAIYEDNSGFYHRVLIKEMYPYKLCVCRNLDNSLDFKDIDAYRINKRRFYNAYNNNLVFFEDSSLKNSTVDARDIFEENNTVYAVFSCDGGTTYDKYMPSSLQECVEITLAIAKVIKRYHELGFLHLDIKPSNVFVLEGSRDIVVLFDYDSVCPIDVIKKGEIESISYSEGYAAPEQIRGDTRGLGVYTDIYAIGAILYSKMFRKLPDSKTRRHDFVFDFYNGFYHRDCYGKELYNDLTLFFKKTLSSNVKSRYKNIGEVVEMLEKIEEEANINQQVLLESFFYDESFVVGRVDELANIEKKMNENKTVVLTGMGGIGKTTLAKEYARTHREQYKTVVLLKAKRDFAEVIADDIHLNITNFSRQQGESMTLYAQRKLAKLKSICDHKTLIIIDSLDYEMKNKELWRDFLSIGCHVIITSRMDKWKLPYVYIDVINQNDLVEKLFMHYCVFEEEQGKYVHEIVNRIGKLTVAVELIAKQASEGHVKPEELLEKIDNGLLEEVGSEPINRNVLDDEGRSIGEHLALLFHMDNISPVQRKVLEYMALMPQYGIDEKNLLKICELDSYTTINELEKNGWIKRVRTNYCMHPVISEIVLMGQKNYAYDILLKKVEELFKGFKLQSYAARLELNDISKSIIKKLMKIKYDTSEFYVFIAEDRMKQFIAKEYLGFNEKCFKYANNSCAIKKKDLYNITGCYIQNLAICGRLDEAMELSKVLLDRLESFDGDEKTINCAQYHTYCSLIYDKKKNYEKAIEENVCSINLLKNAGKDGIRKLILQRARLVSLYKKYKKIDEAAEEAKELLEYSKREIKDKDFLMLVVYDNTALVSYKMADYIQASVIYKKIIELNRFHYGIENGINAYYCNMVTVCEQELENYKEAAKYLDEAEDYEDKYDVGTAVMGWTMLLRAKNYYYLKDYDKALYFANVAKDYCEKYLTDDLDIRTECRDLRADIYIMKRDYKKAITEKESAYNLVKDNPEDDVRLLVRALIGIGQACKSFDYYRAEFSYKAAIKRIDISDYEELNESLEAHENLAALYIYNNEYKKASEECKIAWEIYNRYNDNSKYWLNLLVKDIQIIEENGFETGMLEDAKRKYDLIC